ncbi:hypothetical protein F4604DRAFT_1565221, partial [Suillus subluteus]
IKNNNEIFKVPKFLFEDIELATQFSKLISKALSSIRGNVKNKLMSSISKCSSIIDTARSLAHGCIEVDATHWNRCAFLDLYSASLLPSLHRDLRIKVSEGLGIDVGLDDTYPDPMGGENRADLDTNHDGDDNEDEPDENVSSMAEGVELDPNDSGFGGNGKCAVFTSSKFWRFVDASLEGVHKMVKADAEELNDGTPVEHIVRK